MTEQIENAEIISELKETESKYFLAIHKEAPLKIASQYEILKADRVEAKNKYCNIDKSDANIENVRKAKNALVKLRTAITGKDGIQVNDKKKIKEIFEDITAEFDYKVKSLVDITEPLEKDLASVVDKFDNKAKEEARKAAEEIEKLKKELAELKHNVLVKINGMQKSTDIINYSLNNPDYDFSKISELAEVVGTELMTAYNNRKSFLKEREDLEVEKAKVAEEMAKLKAMSMPKPEVTKKLEEITDAIEHTGDLIDLEEIDEPITNDINDPDTTDAIKELEELIKPFDPSLKEIYDHLYATYPFLHNNKYFMAFGSKVK
jgi:hypothetical protein